MGDLVLTGLDGAVLVTGLVILLLDLWTPREQKRQLGYAAAVALGVIFLASFAIHLPHARSGFDGMYVLDDFALFFKRFFLLAGLLVLVMAAEYADRFDGGIGEFYALTLFALSGMMCAASANDFALLFVSLELVTVTFYVLTSFLRRRRHSLEAGVKYLILGACSSAFLVYGMALVYGTAGTLNFQKIAAAGGSLTGNRLFWLGLLMVLVGLGFKIAMVPFQVWAPDVYQGSPTPATAFLAVGSKATGIVLLLRLLYTAVPAVAAHLGRLLIVLSALTILYGVLCAIPQRNVKRLLGYSSIANAGYLLLGVATFSTTGVGAVLYYLAGYLFTLMAAFAVLSVAMPSAETDDISALAGLHQRSPLLAVTLGLAMVSLAGVPPLAGFFGKFLLFKSALAQAPTQPGLYVLVGVAVVGVVISLYYYFGVIRAMYWSETTANLTPLSLSRPLTWSLYGCIAGMLWLGIMPNTVVTLADTAARSLRF